MQDFIASVAEATNSPFDYAAIPALVAAGASIGASRALEIKTGRAERPCLYAAVVGPSGSGKTPAQAAATKPVHDAQHKLSAEHRKAVQRWENADKKTRGSRPVGLNVRVDDTTTEKLANILGHNPRGVLMDPDELTAWVNRLDAYKNVKGADKLFYLSAWSGRTVQVDRKNQEDTIFVPHPFIGICGGLTPTRLSDLRGASRDSDGHLERILFSYPPAFRAEGEQWVCVETRYSTGWAAALEFLRNLKMLPSKEGDGLRPAFVGLTKCARAEWEKFTTALARQLNDELLPECLRGCYAKMNSYGARLALVLHMLRVAHKETEDENVDGESMVGAARLVAYFQSHARKVYAIIDADERIADARRVLKWLKQFSESLNSLNGVKEIKLSDMHAKIFGSRYTVEEVQVIISMLVKYGYLRAAPEEKRSGPGRSPSPRYQINPAVFS
jgi:hypothetical protein